MERQQNNISPVKKDSKVFSTQQKTRSNTGFNLKTSFSSRILKVRTASLTAKKPIIEFSKPTKTVEKYKETLKKVELDNEIHAFSRKILSRNYMKRTISYSLSLPNLNKKIKEKTPKKRFKSRPMPNFTYLPPKLSTIKPTIPTSPKLRTRNRIRSKY